MNNSDKTQSTIYNSSDVLIIGGGAAGCSAAINLARLGRRVILLEGYEDGPLRLSDLHSGEVLSPGSQQELARLGLTPDDAPDASFLERWRLQEWNTLIQYWPNGRITRDLLPSGISFWQINRGRFYQQLRRLAQREGVEVREGQRVVNLLTNQDGVCRGVLTRPHQASSNGELTPLYAPVVLDAGGRNSIVVARQGLRQPEPHVGRAAYVFFFERLDLPDLTPSQWLQYWLPGGTTLRGSQLAPRLYRFSFETDLTTRQDWFERYGRLAPYELFLKVLTEYWPADRVRPFREACRLPHMLAFAPIGYRVSQIAQDGLLLIGDASGYLDPATGQGLEFALRTGRLAAQSVVEAFQNNRFDRTAFSSYLAGHRAEVAPTLTKLRIYLAVSRRSWLIDRVGQVGPARRLALHLLVTPRPVLKTQPLIPSSTD